jgi:hypothetical protein
MRKVVDSNFLQSDGLRRYLAKSNQNYAVLTDYAAMEAYKGDTLRSIYRSMEILSRYPRQVIVLKGTQAVCGLRGRRAGLQRRLIDERQTQGFGEFCRDLRAAQNGDPSFRKQILAHGRAATAHMDEIISDAAGLPEAIDEVAKNYTGAELRILRNGSPLTEEILDKLIHGILLLAADLMKKHPQVTNFPKATELPNTYIFRDALCAYLLTLRWIEVGGARNVKPEKMLNDIVDISFAAYATYFDGLLTADKKLSHLYEEAKYLLDSFFLRDE